MKFFKPTLIFLSIMFFNLGCEDNWNCLCTEEFVTYYVTVVDSLGEPVDSLITSVPNDRGKRYDFGQVEPPPYMMGTYVVMTDGFKSDFSSRQGKVFFTGIKNNKTATAEFFFKTDKCNCHVNMIAGPDTLVLK